ncbi:hypothetical protein PENSPDRAFT_687930 [Peniophora sp. CONT]|nr:hypothetical protein PENSPDRAFT_687930 [Peniophora sp. CONT]
MLHPHSHVETLTEVVYNSKICIYVSLAGLVMILYDHMLTFGDEVELVWKAPRSIARTLFFINRYCVPSMVIGSVHAFSGISQSTFADVVIVSDRYLHMSTRKHSTARSCRSWVVIALGAGVLSIANSNFIVLLRLWVLWERQKRLIAFTFSFFFTCQLVTLGIAVWTCIKSYNAITYYSPLKTCLFVTRVNVAWLWLPGVVYETVVFSLAVWNALQRPRVEDRALTRQFYRDGGMFFTVLFVMRVLNMAIAYIAPPSLMTLGAFFIWCSTTLTVSRLVMNLRRTAMDNPSLPMAETPETGAIVRTTTVIQHEHYEDSQISRNTTGDFLELNDIRN